MNKLMQGVGSFGLLVALSGCPLDYEKVKQKVKDTLKEQDNPITTPIVDEAMVSGRVISVQGEFLPQVTLSATLNDGTVKEVDTNAQGVFKFESLPADETFVIKISHPDYADQVRVAHSPEPSGQVQFEITLIERQPSQQFDASLEANLLGFQGSWVQVLPNSFINENGQYVTGDIEVSMTPVDVSRPANLAAFPGDFQGVLEGETDATPIISFGTVEFKFHQNGAPVELANGQTAKIRIPIYTHAYQDGSAIALGDQIPLWYLDEQTGVWQQEGEGTVVASPESPTGLALEGEVSHFSWWNCDVTMNPAQAIITVTGPGSTALIQAQTNASIGFRPSTVDTVIPTNTSTDPLFIPSNAQTCFWAELHPQHQRTNEVCVTPGPNELVEIQLSGGEEGPVVLWGNPAPDESNDVISVTGYLGYSLTVDLFPITLETNIDYQLISGRLPDGLNLVVFDNTRARIVGVPTEVGAFTAVISATDAQGDTDNLTIEFTIEADLVVSYNTPLSDVLPFIEDENLRQCVQYSIVTFESDQQLESNAIVVGEVTSLYCYTEGPGNIMSLKGLETLPYLERITIGYSSISDISPLSNLTSLSYLNLEVNQISDLSPLSNLTKLKTLDLFGNQITNIAPLSNLTKLEELDLFGNQITNIAPLANLTSLDGIRLDQQALNSCIDVTPNTDGYYTHSKLVSANCF